MEQLYYLGCLDDSGILTPVGLTIAEFPLSVPFAVAVVRSSTFCIAEQMC